MNVWAKMPKGTMDERIDRGLKVLEKITYGNPWWDDIEDAADVKPSENRGVEMHIEALAIDHTEFPVAVLIELSGDSVSSWEAETQWGIDNGFYLSYDDVADYPEFDMKWAAVVRELKESHA